MGQEYSTKTYKKTYGEGYIKTYPNYKNNKALYDEHRKAYDTISKKRGTSQYYSKVEKGKDLKQNIPTSASTLNIPKTNNETIIRQTTEKRIATPPPKPKVAPVVEIPPVYTSNSASDTITGYRKIDKDALVHPIVLVAGGKYRNIYTNKIVDGEEARRILQYAGYKAKEDKQSGKSMVIIWIIAIALKWIGPLGLILWGIFTRNKRMTDYYKVVQNKMLIFPIEADKNEKKLHEQKANKYIATGIIVWIIQFIIYYA